jgi:cytochrome b subunit of formate dehydrogenase
MIFILILVIGLVAWALHLMQEAIQHREFSLMLAGFLVSSSAAALVAVYFLMGNYVGYMSEMAHRAYMSEQVSNSSEWTALSDSWLQEFVETVPDGANSARRSRVIPRL